MKLFSLGKVLREAKVLLVKRACQSKLKFRVKASEFFQTSKAVCCV